MKKDIEPITISQNADYDGTNDHYTVYDREEIDDKIR